MLGLYLHIPFCRKACTYCNFHFSTQLKGIPALTKAMIAEIEQRKNEYNQPLQTIYFGGGTPSVLPPEQLTDLFEAIHRNFDTSQVEEITLEANPEDISPENLKLWKSLGINRFSLGIQSLNATELAAMNRQHSPSDTLKTVALIHEHQFNNFSIDLIYGSPWKSHEQWEQELQWAIQSGATHISAYALTVEPKTKLNHDVQKGKTPPPNDEHMTTQFMMLQAIMNQNGWDAYEISNYCKPGHRAIHNSNYWKGLPYVGIGPSAHSFEGYQRRWNVANNALYMSNIEQHKPYWESETLTPIDQFNEYLMIRFRTSEGVEKLALSAMNSSWLSDYSQEIRGFKNEGYMLENDTHFKLTNKGKLISDHIIATLMLEQTNII